MSAQKNYWFIAVIYRIPTAHSQPERVAIEAPDYDTAESRLYKLFSLTHASACGHRLSEGLSNKPAETTDDLAMARKFPAPTPL